MAKKITKGDQFVNKADLGKVTDDFIKFYYSNWMMNVNALFAHPMWKNYTYINVEGSKLNPQQTIQYHKGFQGSHFQMEGYQFVPDGSRRVDIMVKGKMTKGGITKTLVQTFALVEVKGSFYLKSTQIYFI